MSSEEPVGLDAASEDLDATDLATRLARLGLTTIVGGGGGGALLSVTKTFDTAALLGIQDFPPSPSLLLLAAPGAGKVAVPVAMNLRYVFGTRAMSAASQQGGPIEGPFGVQYGAGEDYGVLMQAIEVNQYLYSTKTTDRIFLTQPGGALIAADVSLAENQDVYLSGPSFNGGPLIAFVIVGSGSRYHAGDVLSVGSGQVTVTAVDGGGGVTAATITDPGSAFAVGLSAGDSDSPQGVYSATAFDLLLNTLTIPGIDLTALFAPPRAFDLQYTDTANPLTPGFTVMDVASAVLDGGDTVVTPTGPLPTTMSLAAPILLGPRGNAFTLNPTDVTTGDGSLVVTLLYVLQDV